MHTSAHAHTHYWSTLCGWPHCWLSSHGVHVNVFVCACVVWLNEPTNSPFCLNGFIFDSVMNKQKSLDWFWASSLLLCVHEFIWTLPHAIVADLELLQGRRSFMFILIAILLCLESFFIELPLPLAPVKQNIILQGSDEEWIVNELQIVLSETLPCMTGPVSLWSLKDAWNTSIFGSLLKLHLLPWNWLFPLLLLTEFFLAFNTFPETPHSKEFVWLKPYLWRTLCPYTSSSIKLNMNLFS